MADFAHFAQTPSQVRGGATSLPTIRTCKWNAPTFFANVSFYHTRRVVSGPECVRECVRAHVRADVCVCVSACVGAC